ncbi:MAG TPA: rRNA maturation RNase YbeY [Firmicutes bacterium]|nr:rRNA maturation RNase YbeY [Bacillota bacterium]
MEILIQNRQSKIECPAELEKLLEQAVEEVLKSEGYPLEAEVGIALVDDEAIRKYNKIYRGIDSPTDVLSFPQWEGDGPYATPAGEYLLGDILISLERAALQAEEYGHSLTREVTYLVVHGLYHLLGYDHETPEQKEAMRAREEMTLARLGLERKSWE